MKKVWKRINGKVKIAVLICCTLIGGYGILKAPASDQSEMEQELKNREQELMQKESQTTAPNPILRQSWMKTETRQAAKQLIWTKQFPKNTLSRTYPILQ